MCAKNRKYDIQLDFFPHTTWCTKGVVSFYLKLKNEFQAFPTKNLASNWLTSWLGQPIRGLVSGDKWLEFISQSQIKRRLHTTLIIIIF